MTFWNRKKSTPLATPMMYPNLPMIQALGKLAASYVNIKTREDYARIFSTVSEVYSPIMYAAKCFSNMKIHLYKTDVKGKKGEEITSHELLKKLKEPNPLNNWPSFLLNYYVNKKVFGNSYIFKYIPTGFSQIQDACLWVLPSQYIYPVPIVRELGGYYMASDKAKFLGGYSFLLNYVVKSTPNWKPEEILHIKEPNLSLNNANNNILLELLEGRSPLATLEKPITNIIKSYDAQNVILEKRGALGILSPRNNKDAIGAVTLTGNDKADIQEQFKKYGLGENQWQYIITNQEMVWQAMATPLKDLMLPEGIKNSMIAICNSLNFPITLLNYLEGATFSNVNELKKSLYQDNIIPEGENFIAELSNFLKLPEQNLLLECDYSHIPCLQTDAKLEVEKDKVTIDIIRGIQTDIIEGKTTYEAAVSILNIILSMPIQEINRMLSRPIIQTNNTQQDATDTAI
jgi:hypothetical protein